MTSCFSKLTICFRLIRATRRLVELSPKCVFFFYLIRFIKSCFFLPTCRFIQIITITKTKSATLYFDSIRMNSAVLLNASSNIGCLKQLPRIYLFLEFFVNFITVVITESITLGHPCN